VAHQGVTATPLPASQPAGLLANIAQAMTQGALANPASPSAPGRPAPTRTAARPEAAGGLDGWLINRLFGR